MWFWVMIDILLIILFANSIDNMVVKHREKKKEKQYIIQKGIENYNAIYTTNIYHMSGLPLTEHSKCIINLCEDKIVVEGSSNIFKLQKDRIVDMNIKTTEETINGTGGKFTQIGSKWIYSSDATIRIHSFFIIIYINKYNEQQRISFEIDEDYKKIYNYVKNYKNSITSKNEIEL